MKQLWKNMKKSLLETATNKHNWTIRRCQLRRFRVYTFGSLMVATFYCLLWQLPCNQMGSNPPWKTTVLMGIKTQILWQLVFWLLEMPTFGALVWTKFRPFRLTQTHTHTHTWKKYVYNATNTRLVYKMGSLVHVRRPRLPRNCQHCSNVLDLPSLFIDSVFWCLVLVLQRFTFLKYQKTSKTVLQISPFHLPFWLCACTSE